MKIGIICEGEHTDKPVLEKILSHKFPGHEFEIISRDKKAIFLPCFQDINTLINKGIANILVIWDLLPVGYKMAVSSQWSEKPNRQEQRKMLLQKLVDSEELNERAKECFKSLYNRYGFMTGEGKPTELDIRLVCICYSLDGWLLSDEKTLKQLGSSESHPITKLEPKPGNPDQCQKPVEQLTRIFKRCPNKRFKYYNKHTHNEIIIQAYIDNGRLDTLQASGSYCRLIEVIEEWVRP